MGIHDYRCRDPFRVLACWFVFSAGAVQGEDSGLFGYQQLSYAGSQVIEITDYPEDEMGEITVPAEIDGLSVVWIGQSAFDDCSGLTAISLPSTITLIQRSAFERCTALESINFPDGLRSIGARAFSQCHQLGSIELPDTLVTIGDDAFAACTSIETVDIPAGVGTIGDSPFAGCSQLQSITVEAGNSAFSSQGGVLFSAGGTVLKQYPAGRAGAYAMPAGVLRIDESAFQSSAGLAAVTLASSVIEIRPMAFARCANLVEVVFNEGLTKIGHNGFSYCTSLALAVLPDSLLELRTRAFGDCPGLTEMTIPAAMTELGTSVFFGCTSLESIAVAPGSEHFRDIDGVLFDAGLSSLFRYPSARPGSRYAIPASVELIEIVAFEGASELAEIEIPHGVTEIDNLAFMDCVALEEVVLPASLERLGTKDPFSGCSNLRAIYFLGDALWATFPPLETIHPDYRIYVLSSRSGYGGWVDLPMVTIDESTYPAAAWLLGSGYSFDQDINADPGGRGVSLLSSYAFGLDPRKHSVASLPSPEVSGGTLSVKFFAAAAGIEYSVESSSNLRTWSSDGIAVGELDLAQMKTATVDAGAGAGYLRVMVRLED